MKTLRDVRIGQTVKVVKLEILEVLAQLRTPTDSEDQIFLADIGKCKRHHGIPSPFFS